MPAACLGTGCADGYRGQLCQYCVPGYYKTAASCAICPPTLASIIAGVTIALIVALILSCCYRDKLNVFFNGGIAIVDGKPEPVTGFSNLVSATLLGDLWQRMILLNQLSLLSLPPAFQNLVRLYSHCAPRWLPPS
jgi:hypothetical protein